MENTARILPDAKCEACGWPIVSACCNPPFTEFSYAQNYDYWYYCSNKACCNHYGCGIDQEDPDWVVRTEEKNSTE